MSVLNREELIAYKNIKLVDFTPKIKSDNDFVSIDGVLDNIYSCIMSRQFSGTPQEKHDIAMEAKKELKQIYSNL